MCFMQDREEYKYTCEMDYKEGKQMHNEWTPMNSNLHMQSIKVGREKEQDMEKEKEKEKETYCVQVKEDAPIPEKTINNLSNSHEDTLLLLDLMKQKKLDENKNKRVNININAK